MDMLVAVAHSLADVRLAELACPRPGPGEALLRVSLCGICSSDAMDWYVRQKAPSVLGHEPVGVVAEVGPGVTALAVGDRVFTHHHVPCGQCHECRRGFPTCCATFKSTALDPGGFAQFLRIPAPNLAGDTHALPPEVSDEQAIFIEPLACTLRALHKLRPTGEDTVLVIGLGVMGLLNGRAARALGARCVIGSDPVAARRARAAAGGGGFDAVLDPRAAPLAQQVRAANGGRPADLVIVGPGKAEAIADGLAAAGKGATVLLFTPTPPPSLCGRKGTQPLPLDAHAFYFQEQTLTTSYSCGPADVRAALSWLRAGRIAVDDLITHRLGLAEVGRGLGLVAAQGEALKVLIAPWQ